MTGVRQLGADGRRVVGRRRVAAAALNVDLVLAGGEEHHPTLVVRATRLLQLRRFFFYEGFFYEFWYERRILYIATMKYIFGVIEVYRNAGLLFIYVFYPQIIGGI